MACVSTLLTESKRYESGLRPRYFCRPTVQRNSVKIGSHISGEELSTFGVPQVSTFSPSLFNNYINYPCKLKIPNCTMFTYADTASLVHSATWVEAQNNAEFAMRDGWL